ncbi:hypothetical protein RDABS01_010878 [Bienertia sinuspersici]
MVSGFICGTSKLPREEDDYERQTRSADSSPRRSRSKNSNKNPYSTRGLEKFSSLLAQIEEKRQQVYSQVDPNEISFVRFEYSDDHGFKPIVVKAKHSKDSFDHASINQIKSYNIDQKPLSLRKLQSSKSMNGKEESTSSSSSNKVDNEVIHNKIKNMGNRRKLRINQWREPLLVLPMIVILILAFLVLFGRSFAIMCTSIGWYVIPTITNKNANSSSKKLKNSFKRKDYAIRRLSDKKLMTSERTKSFMH